MTILKFKLPNEMLIAAAGLLILGVGLGSLVTGLLMLRPGPLKQAAPTSAVASKAAPVEISPSSAQAAAAPIATVLQPLDKFATQPKPVAATSPVRTVPPLPAKAPAKPNTVAATSPARTVPPVPAAAPDKSNPAAAPDKPAETVKTALPPSPAPLAAPEPTPQRQSPAAQAEAQTQPIVQPLAEQYVSMAAAGIQALEPTSVRFASGRIVTVGTAFPSGEKLLSVDTARGRIITDKRVLNLNTPQRPTD